MPHAMSFTCQMFDSPSPSGAAATDLHPFHAISSPRVGSVHCKHTDVKQTCIQSFLNASPGATLLKSTSTAVLCCRPVLRCHAAALRHGVAVPNCASSLLCTSFTISWGSWLLTSSPTTALPARGGVEWVAVEWVAVKPSVLKVGAVDAVEVAGPHMYTVPLGGCSAEWFRASNF